MTETFEFPAVNRRHPMMIVWFILFISYSSFMIWLAYIVSNIWLALVFSILSLLTPFMIYYSLYAKVIIDNQKVMKKSILGVQTMLYSEIKLLGVYKQEGNFARIIGHEEFDKNDWLGPNFIYIANRIDYRPMSFKQKGSIRFHYFKDLYEKIDTRIKACQ